MTDDRAKIVETTTLMAVLADRRAWDELTAIFADEVRVDYTSLNGGEPSVVSAPELITVWSEALGRLAATQHLVINHLATIDGDSAVATASFQATHVAAPPASGRWVLGGDYRWEMARFGGGWRISGVTMTLRWEAGDRSILHPTTDGAATVAQRFLERLGAMDVDGALDCFAEDAVQELPFAPEGFPRRLDGIDALRRQYGGLPNAYRSMAFPVDAVRAMADPEWLLLEYRGAIELVVGGRYDNRYAGLFHVVDGRIRLFREYFDPIVLARAFAGTDALASTFSLDAQSD